MFLKSRQVMERVDVVECASVDETHKQIGDISPVVSLKKQRVFPMKNRAL